MNQTKYLCLYYLEYFFPYKNLYDSTIVILKYAKNLKSININLLYEKTIYKRLPYFRPANVRDPLNAIFICNFLFYKIRC